MNLLQKLRAALLSYYQQLSPETRDRLSNIQLTLSQTMSAFNDWLQYHCDLPPDAANPHGRKTGPRWLQLLLAAWLMALTVCLVKNMIHRWPSDADMAIISIHPSTEVQTAIADRDRANAARHDYEVSKAKADAKPEAKSDAKPTASEIAKKKTAADEAEATAVASEAKALNTKTSNRHTKKILMLIMLLGAIGGQLHALTSFGAYCGNGTFVGSWIFYYMMRPVVGAMVALLAYLGLLSGLFASSTASASTSNIGLAAACMLVGLCSEMAMAKFIEIFSLVFQTEASKQRANPLAPPGPPTKPVLLSLSRQTMVAANHENVTLTGKNFPNPSQAHVEGRVQPVTWVSATELTLLADAVPANPGTYHIAVVNPETQQISSALPLTLT